jgi:hypothetical protein
LWFLKVVTALCYINSAIGAGVAIYDYGKDFYNLITGPSAPLLIEGPKSSNGTEAPDTDKTTPSDSSHASPSLTTDT